MIWPPIGFTSQLQFSNESLAGELIWFSKKKKKESHGDIWNMVIINVLIINILYLYIVYMHIYKILVVSKLTKGNSTIKCSIDIKLRDPGIKKNLERFWNHHPAPQNSSEHPHLWSHVGSRTTLRRCHHLVHCHYSARGEDEGHLPFLHIHVWEL